MTLAPRMVGALEGAWDMFNLSSLHSLTYLLRTFTQPQPA
ncbi:hypothetical protein SynA1825c_01529 [Synechococcus sp. A18-25c]|nr:hypothetical protein SynA1825c_01529 [Synechococcus sp. A18-25c]